MAQGSTSNPDQIEVTDLPGSGQAAADNVPRAGGPALKDSDIPSTIARDAEVVAAITAALGAHVAASDPHPGYVLEGGPNTSTTALNALTFSALPTQAEVQALRAEVATLFAGLRVHG
jgi:hypothetical protein